MNRIRQDHESTDLHGKKPPSGDRPWHCLNLPYFNKERHIFSNIAVTASPFVSLDSLPLQQMSAHLIGLRAQQMAGPASQPGWNGPVRHLRGRRSSTGDTSKDGPRTSKPAHAPAGSLQRTQIKSRRVGRSHRRNMPWMERNDRTTMRDSSCYRWLSCSSRRSQSISSRSIDNCARIRATAPFSACGHTKRPRLPGKKHGRNRAAVPAPFRP